MEPPSDELDGPSVEYDDKPLLNEIFDDAQERFETWASKFFAPVTEPAARAWRVLLRHELTLLWWFRVTPGGRRLSRFVAPFISNHPFVDISVVTWAAYAGVVWKWGLRPFYCGALNLVAAFALRGLLALPRPCEYDPRLRQFADRGRGGGGFPSLESHMAVVVYGMCAIGVPRDEQGGAWLAAIAASALVGLTRLVAGSRFAHQVLLSYATGGVGLGLGYTYSRYLPRFHLAKSGHTVAIYVIVSYFIAYLGHFAMDNSSRFFSIPNSEFTRVLSGMMDGVAEVDERRQHKRKDSFYGLQKTLMARSKERAQLQRRGEQQRRQHTRELEPLLRSPEGAGLPPRPPSGRPPRPPPPRL